METTTVKHKLPADFLKKWIEALRSGKYQQGNSTLYDKVNDTYCCLGVAGVVAGVPLNKIVGGYFQTESDDYPKIPQELKSSAYHINEWDLTQPCIDLNDGNECVVNPDGKNCTFAEIADWLEQNVEGY